MLGIRDSSDGNLKKTDCICNVHFPDFKGPTRKDKRRFPLKDTFPKPSVQSVVPNAYAKPRHSFGAPRSKRKRFDADDERQSFVESDDDGRFSHYAEDAEVQSNDVSFAEVE